MTEGYAVQGLYYSDYSYSPVKAQKKQMIINQIKQWINSACNKTKPSPSSLPKTTCSCFFLNVTSKT
uniref:Uncharacterized protein n=1 Tax=Anguilla anguilla TaxID=7936 RepID=A0A0E9WVF4_ANGAN